MRIKPHPKPTGLQIKQHTRKNWNRLCLDSGGTKGRKQQRFLSSKGDEPTKHPAKTKRVICSVNSVAINQAASSWFRNWIISGVRCGAKKCENSLRKSLRAVCCVELVMMSWRKFVYTEICRWNCECDWDWYIFACEMRLWKWCRPTKQIERERERNALRKWMSECRNCTHLNWMDNKGNQVKWSERKTVKIISRQQQQQQRQHLQLRQLHCNVHGLCTCV